MPALALKQKVVGPLLTLFAFGRKMLYLCNSGAGLFI